jgi:hypothetical protein
VNQRTVRLVAVVAVIALAASSVAVALSLLFG